MPLPPGPHTLPRDSRPPLISSLAFTVSMSDDEHVAIFWDYENCCPSSSMTGYDIVNNIREIAHTYGSVILFKAYLELSEQSPKSTLLRSELQSCGVSLTDCPHNGRKDVADKMMIVDMLTYALDTPAPATIVLISGDRDFVYAVSVLRLRRYRVVLVAPHTTHNSLRSQATVVLDWSTDVLGKEKLPSGLPTPAEPPRPGHRRAQSSVNPAQAQGSPLAAKASRRLSFRDAPSQRPAIEPLQNQASSRSPRAPTTPLQAAWTPAEVDTAGSSGSLLRPQRSAQIGLPTPSSDSGSAGLGPKSVPEEAVDSDSGDSLTDGIADLNLHLKNFTSSRTPSNNSASVRVNLSKIA
ncbi:NYN domain-containing protein [Rhodofomes roseus]|uniref:NYN domain-containing protein n=1 Tax=Rhodofomes roseus TaxID=34475 RepID=A0ABQ8KX38_9APHY|nr:NYN domain-containing protein [Rhodofomes roseus]KAH9842933.1 NYN domain-containing protein [Rhodofomes roseus]